MLTLLFSLLAPLSQACQSPVLYYSVIEPKTVAAVRHNFVVGDVLVVRPGQLGGTSAQGEGVLEKLAATQDAEYYRIAQPGPFKIIQEFSGKPPEAFTHVAKAPPLMRGGGCGDYRGK